MMLSGEQIFRSMMAEYALIVAGKSDEEAPMQYAKCDLKGIFGVLLNEELGVMCSKIAGYIDSVEERTVDGGGTAIVLRLSADAPAVNDKLIRRRMEDYLVASTLLRCLLPVRSTQSEYQMLVSRARLSMRSLRQLLAR